MSNESKSNKSKENISHKNIEDKNYKSNKSNIKISNEEKEENNNPLMRNDVETFGNNPFFQDVKTNINSSNILNIQNMKKEEKDKEMEKEEKELSKEKEEKLKKKEKDLLMKEKIIREVGNKLKIKIYFNQVISNFQKKKTKKNSLKIHNINEVKEGENEIIEEENKKKMFLV